MEEFNVYLKETVCLKTMIKQPKTQTVELSGLDRMSPAILFTIFFYKNQKKHESSPPSSSSSPRSYILADPFETAKSALKKLLVSWYPTAGRLHVNEFSGKLEILCNDQGVTMVTAETDSKLEELGCLHQYKPCYERLVPRLTQAQDLSEAPLVLVQITRFACGGFSLGFGVSHALFDGFGAFTFLASWAHLSSGKDEEDLLLPNHSRTALLSPIGPSKSTTLEATSIYEQNQIAAIQDLYSLPMKAVASDDRCWEIALSEAGRIDSYHGVQLLTLVLKKEMVETWKELVVERGKLSKCSTFDVLCAQIWKSRVKALLLHPDTNICLQFPVDIRTRLQPQLGKNYSGNAFVLASSSCLVTDLLQEPLHSTVRRIQAAKDVIKEEYIKLFIQALDRSTDKFLPSMKELTIVTDWTKFPFSALDFGWGPVSGVALLATPVPETAFIMPNVEDCGGFLVRIGMESEHAGDFVTKFYEFDY